MPLRLANLSSKSIRYGLPKNLIHFREDGGTVRFHPNDTTRAPPKPHFFSPNIISLQLGKKRKTPLAKMEKLRSSHSPGHQPRCNYRSCRAVRKSRAGRPVLLQFRHFTNFRVRRCVVVAAAVREGQSEIQFAAFSVRVGSEKQPTKKKNGKCHPLHFCEGWRS